MPKTSSYSFWRRNLIILQGLGVFFILIPFYRLYQLDQPFAFIIPNLLLFTSFRQYTRSLWFKIIDVDKRVRFEPRQIPSIEAKDFDMDALRHATENWRFPAVVRGLFKDTPAVQKWIDPEYLSAKIGDFEIPVVRQAIYNTLQNDRVIMTFRESFTDVVTNNQSKMYLFFPVKSRFNFNGSAAGSLERLQDAINEVVLQDLEIDKLIWNGFGTKKHSTYYGSQFVIGKGSADTAETTGTGWHCAAGNNYFIQVAGKKRWYFLDHEHSAYMYPLRGGKVNMMTGNAEMSKIHDHLPLRYVDLEAGDLLYNPDWEWHTIFNYEGLSIGVPIREVNISLSFRNNFLFTSVVMVNKITSALGIDIGGYPPN